MKAHSCPVYTVLRKNFRRFITENSFGIFGVYFYPFALPQLFSIPACELSDQAPDLNSIAGQRGCSTRRKNYAGR